MTRPNGELVLPDQLSAHSSQGFRPSLLPDAFVRNPSQRPSQTWGVRPLLRGRPGAGMAWRVTIELSAADGTKQAHEVARGGGADSHSPLDSLAWRWTTARPCRLACSGIWFRPGSPSTARCGAAARVAEASAR
jgi:hypothetical protein